MTLEELIMKYAKKVKKDKNKLYDCLKRYSLNFK